MISQEYDEILGRIAIIYLGIQTKLPGRSHYQDLAKNQSSSKAETVYFSKYLADPEDARKKNAEPTVATTQQNGGMMDKFPLLKYILADQDNKDDQIQKTAVTCHNSASDCQKLKDETIWTQKPGKKPTNNFSFLSSIFADPSGEEENDSFQRAFFADPIGKKNDKESSFFQDLSSKVHNSDLYAGLVNLLADSGKESKGQTTTSKSEKTKSTKSLFSLSFPSFESIFADPDLFKPFSGEQKAEQAQTQRVEVQQELKEENIMPQEACQEKLIKDTKLETDDLLEAFRIFLQGYATPKNSNASGKEIKSEFKKFLKTKKDNKNVDYKSAYESLKNGQKNSDEKFKIQNSGMGISEILQSFLVDEEFALGEKTIREDPKATDSSKSDDSHDQNHILEALRRLLAEKKEKSNATPSANIVNAFQQFLADDHQSNEIFEKIQLKKKEKPSKTETIDQQDESEVAKLFKGFFANENFEKPINHEKNSVKDAKGEWQSFFSNLLVDTENDGEPINAEKALGGAKILSFFKNQIKSSTQKNEKSPVKEFLDVFASFLADDSVFEEVSNDDPFHLDIKSFLSNGETLRGSFSDEIRQFSSYLKKFIYSDDSEGHKSKKGVKEVFEEPKKGEGNVFENFFENFLA